MIRFRNLAAFLAAFILLFSAAFAEEDLQENDIPLEDLLSGETEQETASVQEETAEVFTPSYGSPWTEDLGSSYWTTPMDITDEETVWNMLMEPINVIDLGKGKETKIQLSMYQEPNKDSKVVGEITNLSQGIRILEHLENGWSHVECYSSSFASPPSRRRRSRPGISWSADISKRSISGRSSRPISWLLSWINWPSAFTSSKKGR